MIFDGATGDFTAQADTGETINGINKVQINVRYGAASFIKVNSTTWLAVGDLV